MECGDKKSKNRIYDVVWDITSMCNLRCKYCYNTSGSKAEELSTEEALGLVDELYAIGVRRMSFGGGEPLLRKDFGQIMNYSAHYGIYNILVTNGTLAERFTPVDLFVFSGLDEAQVSLDGFKTYNTEMRGGRYAKILRAVSGFSKLVRTGVSSVATKKNRGQLKDVLLLSDRLGAHYFRAIRMLPIGRAKEIPDLAELLLSEQEFSELDLELESFAKEKGLRIEYQSGFESKCLAGDFLSIAPNGDVFACEFAPNTVLGNVREATLSEMLESEKLERIKDKRHCGKLCEIGFLDEFLDKKSKR